MRKSTPIRVRELSVAEAAYLAGLIDGERTIALSRKHARENRLRSYKRARAQLVLAEYVALTPRNGKYTDETLSARTEFESRFAKLLPARDPIAVR